MTRTELEHIIRAAGAITNQNDLVVIGSQAILGQYPHAAQALLVSKEADIYFPGQAHLAELVEGAIGELSRFEETFGYYAGSAADHTATLPSGWQNRLVPVRNANTDGVTGWCLEVHDIAVSKYAAGREKDLAYIAVLWSEGLIRLETLEQRLGATDVNIETRARLRSRARADAARHRKDNSVTAHTSD